MSIKLEGSIGVTTPGVVTNRINIGVVGDRRNLIIQAANNSPTMSLFCGAHILGDNNGNLMFTATGAGLLLDLRIIGAGGVVATPTSSWVACYHICNPSNNATNMIAVDLPLNQKATEILDASLMPAGYTFSALACVAPLASPTTFLSIMVRDRSAKCVFPTPALEVVGDYPTSALGRLWDWSSAVPLNATNMIISTTSTTVSGGMSSPGSMVQMLLTSEATSIAANYNADYAVSGSLANIGSSGVVGVKGSGIIPMNPQRTVNLWTAVLSSLSPVQTSRSIVYFRGFTF